VFFIRLQKLHGYSDKPTVANPLAWSATPCGSSRPRHYCRQNQAYHFGCEEGHTIFMARPSQRVYEKWQPSCKGASGCIFPCP